MINPGKVELILKVSPTRCEMASATSGMATKITEPSITPFRLDTPAMTAPVTTERESASGNALGEAVLMVITSKAPERPARAELKVKATIFRRCGLEPERATAVSLLPIPRHVRPYREDNKFESKKKTIRAANDAIQ